MASRILHELIDTRVDSGLSLQGSGSAGVNAILEGMIRQTNILLDPAADTSVGDLPSFIPLDRMNENYNKS